MWPVVPKIGHKKMEKDNDNCSSQKYVNINLEFLKYLHQFSKITRSYKIWHCAGTN